MIFENIFKLEEETKGFDEKEFFRLKNLQVEKQHGNFSRIDQQIGAILRKFLKGRRNQNSKKQFQN